MGVAETRPARQTTNTVVMISPDQFGFNPETSGSNSFQHIPSQSEIDTRQSALSEFHKTVDTLNAHGIATLVLPSRADVITPDAVFPNNWFSHHQEGALVIYPMLAPNRRAEKQIEPLKGLLAQVDIVPDVINMSSLEGFGHILEGTGSLVLDREHKVAFATESPRTTREGFDAWLNKMGYDGVFFHADDKSGSPIYHTNVVMSIGEQFAIACLDAIQDPREKGRVADRLEALGKTIIPITTEQMGKFCGNVLQLASDRGEPKIIMSETAYNAFGAGNRQQLERFGDLVAVHIPVIEEVGGGSARCMLAEVFPPQK